jgi:hypothetical protein
LTRFSQEGATLIGHGTKKPECKFCKVEFTPNYRNGSRQRFCCKTGECRAASKAASQKAWLSKPENRNHFHGSDHVKRVQDWRRKKKAAAMLAPETKKDVLQDDCPDNSLQIQADALPPGQVLLQDDWMQHPVIIGMIAWFTGSVLQEDIAKTMRRVHILGLDILNNPKGGHHVHETTGKPLSHAQGSQPVQLGGPQAGP